MLNVSNVSPLTFPHGAAPPPPPSPSCDWLFIYRPSGLGLTTTQALALGEVLWRAARGARDFIGMVGRPCSARFIVPRRPAARDCDTATLGTSVRDRRAGAATSARAALRGCLEAEGVRLRDRAHTVRARLVTRRLDGARERTEEGNSRRRAVACGREPPTCPLAVASAQ